MEKNEDFDLLELQDLAQKRWENCSYVFFLK